MKISSLRGRATRFVMLGLALPSIAFASPVAFVFDAHGPSDRDVATAKTVSSHRGLRAGRPFGQAGPEPRPLGGSRWRPAWRPALDTSIEIDPPSPLEPIVPSLASLGEARRRAAFAMLLDARDAALVARARDAVDRLLFEVVLRSAAHRVAAWASLSDRTDALGGLEPPREPMAAPEPGTALLVALGLLLGGRARRRGARRATA